MNWTPSKWIYTIGLEKEERRFSPSVARHSKQCKKALYRDDRRKTNNKLVTLTEEDLTSFNTTPSTLYVAPLTMYVNGRLRPCK